MVINIGKALGCDWDYAGQEIKAVTDACHRNKAIVKVIFETDYVIRNEDKIRLCEICTEGVTLPTSICAGRAEMGRNLAPDTRNGL